MILELIGSRATNAQATCSLEHSMLVFMKFGAHVGGGPDKIRYIPLSVCEYKLLHVEGLYSYMISTNYP